MASHSRRRQKCPLVPHTKPCAPRRHHWSMGDDPPSKQMYFFKGVRGYMAFNTLRCYGDASSPEQRSALRAIRPLNTPKIISDCSGGRCPSIWRVSTRRTASCGALGGHFRCRQPWLWRCFVTCRNTNHFFLLNHCIVGIPRKLLSRARQFLRCTEAET